MSIRLIWPKPAAARAAGGGVRYHAYRHELTDADHIELLAALDALTGYVVLSGYPSPLYESALGHWHRVEREALADGARPRVEVLWLNPAAANALHGQRPQYKQLDLIGADA
jgi:DNA adenine methylase